MIRRICTWIADSWERGFLFGYIVGLGTMLFVIAVILDLI